MTDRKDGPEKGEGKKDEADILALHVELVLVDPGPRDLDVSAAIAEMLSIPLPQARFLAADAPSRLASRMPLPTARRHRDALAALGAEVRLDGWPDLRLKAEAARCNILLTEPGPNPEAVATVLVPITGQDLAELRRLVRTCPVIVARTMLPAAAARLVAQIGRTGAKARAVPPRPDDGGEGGGAAL